MPHRFHPGGDLALEHLNDLLRVEAAAAEAYQWAARCTGSSDDPMVLNTSGLLREMREDHGRAIEVLRQCVQALGGQPPEPATDLNGFPVAAADLCRDRSALSQLLESEEMALRRCHQSVSGLDSQSASIIREELIPACERHIDVLEQLIESVQRL